MLFGRHTQYFDCIIGAHVDYRVLIRRGFIEKGTYKKSYFPQNMTFSKTYQPKTQPVQKSTKHGGKNIVSQKVPPRNGLQQSYNGFKLDLWAQPLHLTPGKQKNKLIFFSFENFRTLCF